MHAATRYEFHTMDRIPLFDSQVRGYWLSEGIRYPHTLPGGEYTIESTVPEFVLRSLSGGSRYAIKENDLQAVFGANIEIIRNGSKC